MTNKELENKFDIQMITSTNKRKRRGMMREIKFKGKSIKTNEWHYGNLIVDTWGDDSGKTMFGILSERTAPAFVEDWCPERVDENTISEFTGLYDKNGKEIYENDLLIDSADSDMMNIYKVIYKDGGIKFKSNYIDTISSQKIINDCDLIVIGNIFDNKELLGEQQ